VQWHIVKLVSDRADEQALRSIQKNLATLKRQFQLHMKEILSG
jgi:nucleoside phosphorylase